MISHDNFTWSARRKLDIADDMHFDRIIAYLPASHIAGFMSFIVHFIEGNTIYFAKPDALQGSLIDTMLWCRPSGFGGVPRIWEKLEDKLRDGIR
jgi:long-chain-fatty-acid--CoA ligase ACSBG